MVGHGSKDGYIANMKEKQYKDLRNLLNDVGCSFLYVQTCYGGGNVKEAQTWVVESVRRIKSFKRFIEIAEGIPGMSVKGVKKSIANFFTSVNMFFEHEMTVFKFISESFFMVTGLDIGDITEQGMLAGYPGMNIKPLIARDPGVVNTERFKNIFKGFVAPLLQNWPTYRFPGGSDMFLAKSVMKTEERKKQYKEEIHKRYLFVNVLSSLKKSLVSKSMNPAVAIEKEREEIKRDIERFRRTGEFERLERRQYVLDALSEMKKMNLKSKALLKLIEERQEAILKEITEFRKLESKLMLRWK